jgi:glycosyltransferase involved in cell wall biosynthesis
MKPYTIFVPAYNEEEILSDSVRRLKDYAEDKGCAYEIIIVSNGSTDATERIGASLSRQYQQVKFFSLPEKGVGRAFKKGIREAQHDRLIFMDADLSADLSFIEKANQLLDQNVLVLGTKINGLQNRSRFRRMGSFIFFISVVAVMGLKFTDYAPGAKAYRKDFLLKYFEYIDDFTSFVLNLTFLAHIKKELLVEIPISCEDHRISRFNLWQEAGSKYRGLFTLKFKQLFGGL